MIEIDTYNEVVKILRGTEEKYQPEFKFWTKKQFVLVKIDEQEVLYSSEQKLPVVTYENLFERINESAEFENYMIVIHEYLQ